MGMPPDIAPIRNKTAKDKPWEGNISKKPWDYQVSATIAVLDAVEPLKLAVQLLQLQTIKPYIILVDTGSTPENYKEIEQLRSENIEVHSLKLNAVEHPSDFVAMACDLAGSVCRTKYMLWTHADCFLTRRDVIEELLELCDTENPVVGYRLSPRAHDNWKDMFGHTLTMTEMSKYLEYRIMWNLKQFCNFYGFPNHKPDESRPNLPDTEYFANLIYQDCGVKATLIGDEENFKRNITDHFDHCRSFASGMLYAPEYYKICQTWMNDAMKDARARIKEWGKDGL
jgi:hypothetical protein